MEQITSFTKLLNEYGLIGILGLLLLAIWYTYRHLLTVLLDKNDGLLIKGQRELIESIVMNRESNRINAESNKLNAECNERHSKNCERLTRIVVAISRKINAMEFADLAENEDPSDRNHK